MEPSLVSIIMPAFNGEEFISMAIDSVLAQDYKKWELIIVDDGSTDSTPLIASSYEDPRIRIVSQENKGQAAALNHGLGLVAGEYITTLDVDDWLTTNSILDRVTFLDRNPEIGAVYGDGYYCDVRGKPICRFSEYRVGDVGGDVYDALISSPFFGTGANVMIRRQVVEEHKIRYDESIVWCQDYDIYLRIAEKTTFGVIDPILVCYRLHQDNMTMSMPEGRRLESLIKTKFKVLASKRFSYVSTAARINFFYTFLSNDLRGRVEEQNLVFQHPQFQVLPKKQQANLLRIIANDYLLRGEELQISKTWLMEARYLAPFDPKTFSTSALVSISPKVLKLVLSRWRQEPSQLKNIKSPFEIVKEI